MGDPERQVEVTKGAKGHEHGNFIHKERILRHFALDGKTDSG
jgi:hypothetical protein